MDTNVVVQIGTKDDERMVLHFFPCEKSSENNFWISTHIEVFAGGFTGQVPDFVSLGHLQTFLDQLEALHEQLTGHCGLTTIEGVLSLDLKGDGLGHISAKFDVVDDVAQLNYQTEFDQTALPALISKIGQILKLSASTD